VLLPLQLLQGLPQEKLQRHLGCSLRTEIKRKKDKEKKNTVKEPS